MKVWVRLVCPFETKNGRIKFYQIHIASRKEVFVSSLIAIESVKRNKLQFIEWVRWAEFVAGEDSNPQSLSNESLTLTTWLTAIKILLQTVIVYYSFTPKEVRREVW